MVSWCKIIQKKQKQPEKYWQFKKSVKKDASEERLNDMNDVAIQAKVGTHRKDVENPLRKALSRKEGTSEKPVGKIRENNK